MRVKPAAMARRIGNFSYDRRGFAKLHTHITNLLDGEQISRDLHELNLTNTRVKLPGDAAHLQKIITSLASVRTLLLRGCGLKDVPGVWSWSLLSRVARSHSVWASDLPPGAFPRGAPVWEVPRVQAPRPFGE